MEIKQLDDLIFNRYNGTTQPATPQTDHEWRKVASHLRQRLQLDFFNGNWHLDQEGPHLILAPQAQTHGDFVEYQRSPHQTLVAHLDLLPTQIQLPLQGLDPKAPTQTLTLLVTKAKHSFKPYDNLTRLSRIVNPIAKILPLQTVINHINRMYRRPVFKIRVVIDLGLASVDMTTKNLSYLKSFFFENYPGPQDELYLTNSRTQLGFMNIAISLNDDPKKLSMQAFNDYLVQTKPFTPKQIETLAAHHVPVLNLTELGFHSPEFTTRGIQHPHWLNQPVEAPTKPNKKTPAAPTPQPAKDQPAAKPVTQPAEAPTKPVAESDDTAQLKQLAQRLVKVHVLKPASTTTTPAQPIEMVTERPVDVSKDEAPKLPQPEPDDAPRGAHGPVTDTNGDVQPTNVDKHASTKTVNNTAPTETPSKPVKSTTVTNNKSDKTVNTTAPSEAPDEPVKSATVDKTKPAKAVDTTAPSETPNEPAESTAISKCKAVDTAKTSENPNTTKVASTKPIHTPRKPNQFQKINFQNRPAIAKVTEAPVKAVINTTDAGDETAQADQASKARVNDYNTGELPSSVIQKRLVSRQSWSNQVRVTHQKPDWSADDHH